MKRKVLNFVSLMTFVMPVTSMVCCAKTNNSESKKNFNVIFSNDDNCHINGATTIPSDNSDSYEATIECNSGYFICPHNVGIRVGTKSLNQYLGFMWSHDDEDTNKYKLVIPQKDITDDITITIITTKIKDVDVKYSQDVDGISTVEGKNKASGNEDYCLVVTCDELHVLDKDKIEVVIDNEKAKVKEAFYFDETDNKNCKIIIKKDYIIGDIEIKLLTKQVYFNYKINFDDNLLTLENGFSNKGFVRVDRDFKFSFSSVYNKKVIIDEDAIVVKINNEKISKTHYKYEYFSDDKSCVLFIDNQWITGDIDITIQAKEYYDVTVTNKSKLINKDVDFNPRVLVGDECVITITCHDVKEGSSAINCQLAILRIGDKTYTAGASMNGIKDSLNIEKIDKTSQELKFVITIKPEIIDGDISITITFS